jgi:hypothetical protein
LDTRFNAGRNKPGTLVGSIFDATNKDFGTYVVQYTLNPVPTEPDCPTNIKLNIVVNPEVKYQIQTDIKVCNNVPKPPKPKTMVDLDKMFIGQPVLSMDQRQQCRRKYYRQYLGFYRSPGRHIYLYIYTKRRSGSMSQHPANTNS